MDPLVSYHNTPFIDLNEDQPQDDDHLFHNLISPHISPSLTLSYQQQDQPQFFCREEQSFQLQSSLEVDHKIVSSGGSCDHLHHHPKVDQETESEYNDLKLRIWKSSSDNNSTLDGSVKWTSSKMRMMKKMIITNTDHNHHQDHNHDHDDQSNVDDHRLNHSPIMNFTSSTSSSSNIINNNTTNNAINTGMVIVRACSDCNTTKTPLWRSGPRGPKSLCNACGIRQRKARRAMAAAAANGTGVATVGDKKSAATTSKIQSKVKKSKIGANPGEDSFGNNPQFKKRSKPGRKKLACFEDILRISMKKSSAFHHVFPQDEKDAAILLMALSYGLVHG